MKEFTLFYVYNPTVLPINEMFKEILKNIDLVFPKEIVSLYKVSDKAIAVLINKKFLKKNINDFKRKLKNYLIIDIRSNLDIFPNANLKFVIDYLDDTKVSYFNIDDYKNYRLTKEENKYKN